MSELHVTHSPQAAHSRDDDDVIYSIHTIISRSISIFKIDSFDWGWIVLGAAIENMSSKKVSSSHSLIQLVNPPSFCLLVCLCQRMNWKHVVSLIMSSEFVLQYETK